MLTLLVVSCKQHTPALYLIGDSTMADKPDKEYPERGWGQLLPIFFNSTINISNYAKNGRSTRSFIYEARWDSVLNLLQPGDFVVIQFGHNDGVESKTGRHATPAEYAYNLSKFIADTKAKKCTPILCTPIARRNFVNGKSTDTHGEYPDIARQVAAKTNTPLIDMHKTSIKLLTQLGEQESLALFLQIPPGEFQKYPDGKIDNTHLSEKGAIEIAKLFIDEVKTKKLTLANHLKNE
jgi:DNA sulfur modification protein DndE